MASGQGEQKAGIAANTAQPDSAVTTPAAAPDAQLPTNHPPTKDQLKAYRKQQAQAAKQQKKAQQAAPTTAPQPATQPAANQPATNQSAATQQ